MKLVGNRAGYIRILGGIMKLHRMRKWLTGTLAIVAFSLTSTGLALHSAKAETSTDYPYWHFTKGSGEYAINFNNRATNATDAGYTGVETVITRKDPTVKDIGVTLNGAIAPLSSGSGDLGKNLIFFDYASAPAEAIVITYTSLADRTKQISLIATFRGVKTYFTAALTDDITVADGYAYVEGAKTVGTAVLSGDATSGSIIQSYSTDGFDCWQPDSGCFIGRDGYVYVNNSFWNKAADVNDETWLNLSKEGLPADGKYAERYTVDYANEIIASFETGCTMSVTYYGVNTDVLDFHIRNYTGRSQAGAQSSRWIDAGGGNENIVAAWHASPINYQKTSEVYKYATYNVQDLVYAGSTQFNPATESFTGRFGCDSTGAGGVTFDYSENPTVTFGGEDAYLYIDGQNGMGHYAVGHTFLYKVVDSTPVVSAVESSRNLIVGQNYDLSTQFTTFAPVGGERVEYKIDGVAITLEQAKAWTMDNAEHTVSVEVTDGAAQKGSASFKATPCAIELSDSVTLTKEEGTLCYFQIPGLPAGAIYTLALYEANADVATAIPYTTSTSYSFPQSGEYKLVYSISLSGVVEPIQKTVAYHVTVVAKEPTIRLSEEYATVYYTGKKLNVLSATASDGSATVFTVSCALYKDGKSVKTGAGEYALQETGGYEIVYSVVLDDGRTVEKRYSFTVEKDEERPTLVLNGSYAAQYKEGTVIQLLSAQAFDNDEAQTTIAAYRDGEQLSVSGDSLKLTGGAYKIVYVAVDNSGNRSEEIVFEFTVDTTEEGDVAPFGCNCGSSIASSLAPITIAFAALALIRRKFKEEN